MIAPYHDEMWCQDDGGGGAFWCTALGRTASEAGVLVERIVGPFEDGFTVDLVTGRVEGFPVEGGYFHKDSESEEEFWEIETR